MKHSFVAGFSMTFLTCLSLLSCKQDLKVVFKPDVVNSSVAPLQSPMIGALLQEYLHIKDALVETKSDKVNQSAIVMLKKLKVLQDNFNSVAAQNKLPVNIAIQIDSIRLQLTQIITHNDQSCEPQRIYFKFLSDNILTLIEDYGITNSQLYSYFCPNAMNGKKGAWWLSNSRSVENPYFGSKMLTCGELVDTLK